MRVSQIIDTIITQDATSNWYGANLGAFFSRTVYSFPLKIDTIARSIDGLTQQTIIIQLYNL